MGLWKSQIDQEIGTVNWDEQKVYEKIQNKKRNRNLKKPLLVTVLVACLFALIFVNPSLIGTFNNPGVNSGSMLIEQESDVKAYYYSVYETERHYFYAGSGEQFIGVVKGTQEAVLEKMLMSVKEPRATEYFPEGDDVFDIVVVLQNDTQLKLKVFQNQLYDVENKMHYYTDHWNTFTMVEQQYRGLHVTKVFHGLFLLLIALTLLMVWIVKVNQKLKWAFTVVKMAFLIQCWNYVFMQFSQYLPIHKSLFLILAAMLCIIDIIYIILAKASRKNQYKLVVALLLQVIIIACFYKIVS